MTPWTEINSGSDIEKIKEASYGKPVLIFKHSTTCPISSAAKDRIERNCSDLGDDVKPFFLDLLSYRNISNAIATEFAVRHESPQVLLIKNGECVYDESHFGIRASNIKLELA